MAQPVRVSIRLPAGPRVRGLLARLALDAGRPVDAATLVDALCGEDPPGAGTDRAPAWYGAGGATAAPALPSCGVVDRRA